MAFIQDDERDELYVLFVDDDPMQLVLVKPLLENFDSRLHVETLTNPRKVMEYLKHYDFDCVVSEYIVGGNHDVNVFKAVKNAKTIPTILYTTRDFDEVEKTAQMFRVNGYIQKIRDPKEYPQLIRFIREIVERYQEKRPDKEFKYDPRTTWNVKNYQFYGSKNDSVVQV
ncbi:MAG: response regulator [Candidatus Bathyarchaeota archaeon]|nr:response regulator [Candidatus Bathyarchaeota archaeon]